MGWKPDANEADIALSEDLTRDDDGLAMGFVARYEADSPTYAYRFVKCPSGADHYHALALGSFSTDVAAREAVEMARLAFGENGSALR